MDGHRQSALFLHSMSESDRRWILERLADGDRHILNAHLAELADLGIPRDNTLIDAAKVSVRKTPVSLLRGSSATRIQALLADEPIWLVQHVLALDDWPWRQEFLDAFSASRRKDLATSKPTPLSPTLAARLRNQLEERLAQGDSDHPAHRPVRKELLGSARRTARRWLYKVPLPSRWRDKESF